jgi:FeS assembly SUF system protein
MNDRTSSRRVVFDPSLTPHERLMQQFASNNGPAAEGEAEPAVGDGEAIDDTVIHDRVIAAIKTIYDPEIPVNIYDLGLIYRVEVRDRFVEVDMTLTAPGCPVAQTFPGMVEGTIRLVPGVEDAMVELVWDPPWRQDMISEAARLDLGLI